MPTKRKLKSSLQHDYIYSIACGFIFSLALYYSFVATKILKTITVATSLVQQRQGYTAWLNQLFH